MAHSFCLYAVTFEMLFQSQPKNSLDKHYTWCFLCDEERTKMLSYHFPQIYIVYS